MILDPHFILMGIIGAVLYVLIWSRNWEDLKQYEVVRHIAVGAIVGYVYGILHSDYNFPNAIMSIVAGYFGPDFIEGLMERLRPAFAKPSRSQNKK
jgi:uncharacterized membrane protein YeaQ/YmgE (transglycosylase-associated protein family)